jgi:hypothetical protein
MLSIAKALSVKAAPATIWPILPLFADIKVYKGFFFYPFNFGDCFSKFKIQSASLESPFAVLVA